MSEKHSKISYVSFAEIAVMNEPGGFEGWRMYRIEYYITERPFAVKEEIVWLPPNFDAYNLEDEINEAISANAEKGDGDEN